MKPIAESDSRTATKKGLRQKRKRPALDLLPILKAADPGALTTIRALAVVRLGELIGSSDEQVALKASQALLEYRPHVTQPNTPENPMYAAMKACEAALAWDLASIPAAHRKEKDISFSEARHNPGN